MTEQTLLELLREYTDKTGETCAYGREVFIRTEGITEEWNVTLFKGSSVCELVVDTNLDLAISRIKALMERTDV